MDLSNGRYLALGLQNEEPHSYDFSHQAHARPTISRACCSVAASASARRSRSAVKPALQARTGSRRWPPGSCSAAPPAARRARIARAAEPARLAAHSLLIAIAAAGERLVAVGDRGIIVWSDDRGASWTQAAAVPTQALLTGVCFADAQHGVAVGHDEAILITADAGRTWQLTHYAPQAQRRCSTSGAATAGA